MTEILTIDAAQKHNMKQHMKIMLGQFAAKTSPRRTKELLKSPLSAPTNLRDKSIMAFLKHQSQLEQREEFFEALHQDFWSNEGGAVFARKLRSPLRRNVPRSATARL